MSSTPLSTTENTSVAELFETYILHIPVLITLSAITMITALLGNLFLAFIIVKKSGRRRLSPVQILILHTCIADILFAFITILPQMAQFLTFPYFYGGNFLCKAVKYLSLIPMYASPYLLVAISTDRYIAVCKPLKAYRLKYRLVHWLAAGAWGVSLISSMPNAVIFEYRSIDESPVHGCVTVNLTLAQEQFTVIFFSVFAWLLPSITVAVLYTFVCVEVWSSVKNVTSSPYQKRRSTAGSVGGGSPAPTRHVTLKSVFRKRSSAFVVGGGVVGGGSSRRIVFGKNGGRQQRQQGVKLNNNRRRGNENNEHHNHRNHNYYNSQSSPQQHQQHYKGSAVVALNNNGSTSDGGSLRKVHNSSLSANKIKTVKLTISIVACNFLMLAPFCLVNFISLFPNNIDEVTSTCIMLIGNANSCVNPWIYLIFNYKQVWNLLFKKRTDVGRLRFYQSTVSCRPTLNYSTGEC